MEEDGDKSQHAKKRYGNVNDGIHLKQYNTGGNEEFRGDVGYYTRFQAEVKAWGRSFAVCRQSLVVSGTVEEPQLLTTDDSQLTTHKAAPPPHSPACHAAMVH